MNMPKGLRRLCDRDPATKEWVDRTLDLVLLDSLMSKYRVRNRRGFDLSLDECFATTLSYINNSEKIKRSNIFVPNLSLLFFDLLNLRGFNDKFGHLRGDELLKYVGRQTSETIRRGDIPARWGGDEYAIIMPSTPYSQAVGVTRRIVSALVNNVPEDFRSHFGVYGGLATFSPESYQKGIRTPQDLVDLADERLYVARTHSHKDGHSYIIGEDNEIVFLAP